MYMHSINALLEKPLWQMTGQEFMTLAQTSLSAPVAESATPIAKQYVYGNEGIASIFNCSIPTAIKIKKSGKIDKAITQVGRKIVVDVELAIELAGRKPKLRKRDVV